MLKSQSGTVRQEKRGLLVGSPGDDDTSGRCADPERQGPFSGRCSRINPETVVLAGLGCSA